jgi:glucose-1-phosphate thymidylyltransferase
VTRAVVLAAGKGRRLAPATDVVSKCLLPVAGRPMIHWTLTLLGESGIRDVMVVIGGAGAPAMLEALSDPSRFGLKSIVFAHQRVPAGIPAAIALSQSFVGDQKFVVLLADNVFESSLAGPVANFAKQGRGARVLLKETPEIDRLKQLGVPCLEGGRITAIVEKPDDPPSNLAVTGAYFFGPDVFDRIGGLSVGPTGEFEISDVTGGYAADGLLEHDTIEDGWLDAGGSFADYESATATCRVWLARRRAS